MATFGTWRTFSFLLFEDLALGVIITVTSLTAETGMLSKFITGNTFERFCLKNLAACLVLKLIILAQEVLTEGTAEDSPSMIPDTAVTLNAVGISQRTRTRVSAQTFPTMAHPSFTEVAHCTHHAHSSAVDPRMFDDTV